jgi:uncharacterized integral membrane protein
VADEQLESGEVPSTSTDEGYAEGPVEQTPESSGATVADQGPALGTELRKGPPSTRTSAAWTALAVGLALLVVVLVFILENLQKVKVSLFGLHWYAPLAVDLLLAAVLGGLVVFMTGALRILQLRRHARRRRAKVRAELARR